MPSQKRLLDHKTSSIRRKKRRKTNDLISAKTLRRSSRLKAKHCDKNKPNNNTLSTTNNPQSLRRSSRIQQKAQRSTTLEISDTDIEIQTLSPNTVDCNQMKTNYEPLLQPINSSHSIYSSTDSSTNYNSLYNRMELGLLSISDFRSIIHENELNNFWTDITSGQYSLQSVDAIFADSQSTDKKISAFALHSTELLAFSGTKDGYIGITNFSQFPYQTISVRCHSDKITDIHTSNKRQLHLYTSGFDGKIKILDLMRIPSFQLQQMDAVEMNTLHHDNNNTYFGDTVVNNNGVIIHGFDIKNGGREIYGVDHDGVLLHCDVRNHRNHRNHIAEKKIATIRIHPMNDNYFVIAENKYKTLQLWDFRYIKQSTITPVHQRKYDRVLMTVNFSENGDRLLSCGRDDFIRVYDNPLNTFYDDVIKTKHKNNTGIWICDYKPVFHPKYSEIVLTGNLDQKGIDVLHFGRDHQTKRYNVHDLTKTRGVHTFGAVHRRFSDYLFGVTYDKLVFYANIPDTELF